MRWALLAWILFLGGCTTDPLYTVCADRDDCGTRTERGRSGDYDISLYCIEATVMVSPDRTTDGAFCTLRCTSDADCDSRIGLPNGRCVELAGDTESYCYQRCDDGNACYPSSACETIFIGGDTLRVCLPTQLP